MLQIVTLNKPLRKEWLTIKSMGRVSLPSGKPRNSFVKGSSIAGDPLCAYCGRPGDTLDHVRPRSRGGLLKEEILCAAAFIATRQKAAKVIGVRNGSGNKNTETQDWWSPCRENAIQAWLNEETSYGITTLRYCQRSLL